MTRLYKRPQSHNIYWAIEEARACEQKLAGWVSYRHVAHYAHTVGDDMAQRALIAKGSIALWAGDVPADALPNQLSAVYLQQGERPKLDWANLSLPFELNPPSVTSVFGFVIARGANLLDTSQNSLDAAQEVIAALVPTNWDGCMAMYTIGGVQSAIVEGLALVFHEPSYSVISIPGLPADSRPC